MGFREAIARHRMQEKLKRGQCRFCSTPLRDDETGPFCSPACLDDWLQKYF